MTVHEILTALYNGLSRFGLGMMGMPYPEEPTLGPVVVTVKALEPRRPDE